MEKQFLSRIDFAKRLGVSLSAVDRGIKSNTYPYSKHIRVGARVLYPESLLVELCAKAMQEKEDTGGVLQ
jgi:predicted DNA-binding transcriptional regulator AlpA